MKRYKYDSIIKGAFNSIGCTLFFVATIYFILMIPIDNLFSITALIFVGSGFFTIIVGYLMRLLFIIQMMDIPALILIDLNFKDLLMILKII